MTTAGPISQKRHQAAGNECQRAGLWNHRQDGVVKPYGSSSIWFGEFNLYLSRIGRRDRGQRVIRPRMRYVIIIIPIHRRVNGRLKALRQLTITGVEKEHSHFAVGQPPGLGAAVNSQRRSEERRV